MSPAAHIVISHAWARSTLVFWAVLIISTAFEMAHHVLAVIFLVCRTFGGPRSNFLGASGKSAADRGGSKLGRAWKWFLRN
jgi:hypothetical protein